MRILLYGFGTVGQGVYEIGQHRKESLERSLRERIEWAGIVVRNPKKKRKIAAPADLFTDQGEALLEDPNVDTIVEVTSDKTQSIEVIRRALALGKRVVTANKAAVAAAFPEFLRSAFEHHASFRYEACVAGGIPVLEPLLAQSVCNKIFCVRGIVNGSSNYVLTELAQGRNQEEVLREARAQGVLEEDPTDDLEGLDAQRKLAILATIVSGKRLAPSQIPCLGITNLKPEDFAFAQRHHRVVRLVASFQSGAHGAVIAVRPVALYEEDSLAGVSGIFNQVEAKGSDVGDLRFYGLGGGASATANAVWTDLLRLPHTPTSWLFPKEDLCMDEERRFPFYVRFSNAEETRTFVSEKGEVTFTNAFLSDRPDGAVLCPLKIREAEALSRDGVSVIEWAQEKSNG